MVKICGPKCSVQKLVQVSTFILDLYSLKCLLFVTRAFVLTERLVACMISLNVNTAKTMIVIFVSLTENSFVVFPLT